MWFNKFAGALKKTPPKKLGLALGSGGAKGMAHLGIIRAFEEENIAFDIVTGASIGSIVGGMYARGLSSANMVSYLSDLGLTDPQKLIMYKLSGLTVEKILDRMLGGAQFDELFTPFKAVAVDIFKGEVVVLDKGSVSRAMSASSAIPPIFKAVEIDGRQLADGAYMNNVPADVAKNMGADFVVGVSLSSNMPSNNLIKAALDDMYPGNKVPLMNRAAAGEKYSDYLFTPDLTSFSSASYKKLDEMFDVGYKLAKEKMPEIKALLVKRKIRKF